MSYYNLIKLAENQASNEQSSGPSVMGTVGLGALGYGGYKAYQHFKNKEK